jgi:formate hydrogenlyase subunit 3/multisubunit Na+/H+ antiporter MnhD subunit
MQFNELGKVLVVLGVIAIVIGVFFMFGSRWISNLNLGKLPGDINIEKDNFSFHFPIVTSIIISIIISIILNIFLRK